MNVVSVKTLEKLKSKLVTSKKLYFYSMSYDVNIDVTFL